MRKILKLVPMCAILILLLATSGCNEENSNMVTSMQIESDLKQHQKVTNCFESNYVSTNEFVYDKYEIIKRKLDSDKGTDTINCYLYATNEYFSVKIEANLIYTNYDVGGWALDDLEVLNKKITPLRAPDFELTKNEVIACHEKRINTNGYLSGNEWLEIEGWLLSFYKLNGSGKEFSRHLRDFKFENIELSSDGVTAKLNVRFASSLTKVKGYFPFELNEKTGWQWVKQENSSNNLPMFIIADYEADYTAALGTFKGHATDSSMTNTILEIVEITDSKIKANITYHFGYSSESTKSKEFDFDVFSGYFHDSKNFYINYDYYFNPTTNSWEAIDYGVNWIEPYERIN